MRPPHLHPASSYICKGLWRNPGVVRILPIPLRRYQPMFIPLRFLLALICLANAVPALADIVKPALVEISVYSEGRYRIEIRASIEALLTGINARYQDTTPVSYTHLTLPTIILPCRSRWSPYH